MKKLLLSLGALAAVVAPVATVVACGSSDKTVTPKVVTPEAVPAMPTEPVVATTTHSVKELKGNIGEKTAEAIEISLNNVDGDATFNEAQVNKMIAEAAKVGTITDVAAFRAALAKQTLNTIGEFNTSEFVTVSNGEGLPAVSADSAPGTQVQIPAKATGLAEALLSTNTDQTATLTPAQVDAFIAQIKANKSMTILDEAGLRAELAKQTLTTIATFETSAFVSVSN